MNPLHGEHLWTFSKFLQVSMKASPAVDELTLNRPLAFYDTSATPLPPPQQVEAPPEQK
jgi:hypothetical protein